MREPASAQVLWEYNRWRCEYVAVEANRGIVRLLDGQVRVLEADCSEQMARQDFARTCRQLVETAEYGRRE